jgi:RadC-like JAB domain
MYRLPVCRVALVREATVATETRAIRCPGDAAAMLRTLIGDYHREALAVLLLNTKHRIIAGHIAGVGTLDSAAAGPREIFRAAILAGAKAIILGHNPRRGSSCWLGKIGPKWKDVCASDIVDARQISPSARQGAYWKFVAPPSAQDGAEKGRLCASSIVTYSAYASLASKPIPLTRA